MRRSLILFLFLIFITALNKLNVNISFTDYYSLMFLEKSYFLKFGLNILDFKYIISFYLLIILYINFTTSYINETGTFWNLVIYREGKIRTMLKIFKKNIIQLMKYNLLLNITIIVLSIFAMNITFEGNKLNTYLIFNIYLIRYFLLIFILTMNNVKASAKNKFSSNFTKINIILIIFIIADIFFNMNIITFSGNIELEIVYLLFYTIIAIIYYYISFVIGGKND